MKIKRRITAHRGLTEFGDIENTMVSFKRAIEYKIEAVELDIRKTKDNILIVHHDNCINNIKITDLNYQEILSYTNQVPKFEDVLQLCRQQLFLDIEIKEIGYEEEVIKMIKRYLEYDEYFIRSFFDKVLIKVKKIDKNIKTGLLLGVNTANFLTRLSELFPLFRIIKTKCDFVSPHYRLLVLGYIKRMHLIKRPVITWTLNDVMMMKKLWQNKIDGIITDIPVEANIQLNQ